MRSCLFRTLGELGPGCRLPWMPLQLPVCGTSEDYQALFNYTRMFSRIHIVWQYSGDQLTGNKYYMALKRIEDVCKERCVEQCYKETITLSMADRLNHKKNATWVALSISEGLYVSRQSVAYDSQQMMSDIGGNLGLLLGASAMTLYDVLENFLRRCWKRRCSSLNTTRDPVFNIGPDRDLGQVKVGHSRDPSYIAAKGGELPPVVRGLPAARPGAHVAGCAGQGGADRLDA
ncbi:uncharacterized protein LOC119091388 [Pollicipes pollicipes]|uniref:uncharacterized protein LOC119091388 n=1 Tax=Pollicipes pollicipes TaxID=41117 RepID=UPI00188497DD|nr:uncharacterized protein LOC119091388 [Pollicipes pollicipes]